MLGETDEPQVVYTMRPDWQEMRQLSGGGFLADTPGSNRDGVHHCIHPDHQAETWAAIERAIAAKGIFEHEHRVIGADGRAGWTVLRAVPLLDEAGAITEWFGAATDITARREAEERLKESTERFRTILESATDYAIFTTDAAGRIETWPSGAQAVFGWPEDEAVGQPVDITFTPEDRATGEPERQEARENGQAANVRWHFRKDGTRVFIERVRGRSWARTTPPRAS